MANAGESGASFYRHKPPTRLEGALVSLVEGEFTFNGSDEIIAESPLKFLQRDVVVPLFKAANVNQSFDIDIDKTAQQAVEAYYNDVKALLEQYPGFPQAILMSYGAAWENSPARYLARLLKKDRYPILNLPEKDPDTSAFYPSQGHRGSKRESRTHPILVIDGEHVKHLDQPDEEIKPPKGGKKVMTVTVFDRIKEWGEGLAPLWEPSPVPIPVRVRR